MTSTPRGREGVDRKWTGVDGGGGVMSSVDVHTKIYTFIFKSWNFQTLKLYNKLNYIKL